MPPRPLDYRRRDSDPYFDDPPGARRQPPAHPHQQQPVSKRVDNTFLIKVQLIFRFCLG